MKKRKEGQQRMIHLGDITKISGYDAPVVDCIVGGSHCQDLSIAGLRKGMQHESLGNGETTRSGLFMEQIRIVKEMRESDIRRRLQSGRTDEPIRSRYMLWENVCGAFSSNKGDDFRVVLEEVARISEEGVIIPRPPKGKWSPSGFIVGDTYSLAWRSFDAQYWGTPQRRKRICLVADFNGHSAPQILFDQIQYFGDAICGDKDTSDGCTGDGCRSEVPTECESLSGHSEQSREKGEESSTDAKRSTGTSCAYTMQDREGKPGGGKGALIAEDVASTLRTNNYQYLFQPKDNPNVYRADGGDGQGKTFTIVGDHENRPTDMTNLIVEKNRGGQTVISTTVGEYMCPQENLANTLMSRDYKDAPIVVYEDRNETNSNG